MSDTPPQTKKWAPGDTILALLDRLDLRWLVVAGLFGLGFRLLWLIQVNPRILDDAPFMAIATLIMGGSGIGAIVAFMFGGTKSGSAVMESQNKVLTSTVPDPKPPETP
jgi:hypothetical protein